MTNPQRAMPERRHPHSGASYKILRQKDATFGVEVTIPDAYPTIVTSFADEAEAERWIAKHKEVIARDEPLRRRLDKSAKPV